MTKHHTILLVEDDAEIRKMLSIFLGVEDFEIIEAVSGKSALEQISRAQPDLILLDLGLPDIDGHDVLSSVRASSNVPVVILTARSDDREIVRALEAGANDYITKPFRADILLARINANLRRLEKPAEKNDSVINGPIHIDVTRHEIFLDGKPELFTPKEFALLEYFTRQKGRVLMHKQILREVWGPAHVNDTQYLRVYIGQVRNKLSVIPGLSSVIEAVNGVGYRMEVLRQAPATT